jgi:Bacterial-like globin
MKKRIASIVVAGSLTLTLATALFAQKKGSLYDSLGGKKAITAVVDEFVSRVAADNRINSFFKQTASDPKRLASFKAKLVDQDEPFNNTHVDILNEARHAPLECQKKSCKARSI